MKQKGHMHPITHMIHEINSIFYEMGFELVESPEIESEYYNFDALNIPKDHPARDMQDTFWIKDQKEMLLRTHISNTQVRYMEKHKPPFRILYLGRVFRNEATDSTHEAQFYQFETLAVGEDITLSNMKAIIKTFLKKIFGDNVDIRIRPGYFPFVEPGVEVDVSCFKCVGKGYCSMCKSTGWIEVLGAGMVHPNVLNSGKINPQKWQGFAFGVGLDRIAMLKYKIDDIRLFYTGDLRFVQQF
jgi:phenylalanyl-tRNA synthetase alpha chain